MFAALPDNEPLTQSSMLTRKVTGVQKQVEWHHFDSRKHVLEYDDVINKHREIIYARRNVLLTQSENLELLEEKIKEMVYNKVKSLVMTLEAKWWKDSEKTNIINSVHNFLGRNIIDDLLEKEDISWIIGESVLADYIADRAVAEIDILKSEAPSEEAFHDLLKRIMLQAIDRLWMNHIDGMSKLREQVAFVGYAQKQPLMVYKEKAFDKFHDLLSEIELKTVKAVFSINPNTQIEIERIDDSKLQVQSTDVENMKTAPKNTNSPNPLPQKPAVKANPLFAQPQQKGFRQPSTKKKKIRV